MAEENKSKKESIFRRLLQRLIPGLSLKTVGDAFRRLFLWQSGETAETEKRQRTAIFVFRLVFIAMMGFLITHFSWLMLVKGKQYRQEAGESQTRTFTTSATRGNIYDCNGKALAVTVESCTISVSRDDIRTHGAELEEKDNGTTLDYQKKVASGLARILGLDYSETLSIIQKDYNYWNAATDISVELGEEISAWIEEEAIKGVSVQKDTARYYPYGSLAAHVIGFTGADDTGLVCGIEVALNSELSGTDGVVVATVEKNGNAITGESRNVVTEKVDGYNAVLTIDTEIQKIAEEVLEEAVTDFGVIEGAAAIVMDPSNGDVLAMVSNPTFDLNEPRKVDELMTSRYLWTPESEEDNILTSFIWKNRALSISYEPGSTFKAITASIALEENVVGIEESISDDPLSLADWTIHCSTAETEQGHGEEIFRLAVANSCNPVMARVALRVGVDKFYSYVKAFGFKNKTNILLSGETVGVIHGDPSEIDLAVTAFGQRFTITPIQLATAYCAIANGGTLYEPRIVSKLTDSSGNTVKTYEPVEVRQVISEETSKTVMSLLEGVVSQGTGERAYVAGYRIAGKTGTSQTTETETTGRYVVSFSAVAPSDNPEIVVLVVLDHPTIGEVSGAKMGAWTAASIAKRVLNYMDVEKVYTEDDAAKIRNVYYVGDYVGRDLVSVKREIKDSTRLYNVEVIGEVTENSVVTGQYPEAGTYIAREGTIILYVTEDGTGETGLVKVPNVVGMSICEAHNLLTGVGLNMDCRSGSIITEQSIEPGTAVETGTVVVLKAE